MRRNITRRDEGIGPVKGTAIGVGATILIIGALFALWFAVAAMGRQQQVWTEQNQVAVNEIRIAQQEQLIQVERQKAEIRVVEAQGIARSQQIINATLTPLYLQHEAIQAQERMANSPNHTTVYIPSGSNGIPLVQTLDKSTKNDGKE